MTIRAILYGRISTDLQREESIDDQFRVCQRTAEQADFRVVGRFADDGISGGTAERPGYQALIRAARAGEFDVIIAEDISRLWRNRAEFGSRSAEFEDLGIHLVTTVGDDTRRDGWMVITIKLALAEQQRREISYRTRRGMEGLALANLSTGGRCLGYRGIKLREDDTSAVTTIHEEEARTVVRIFTARAAGASLGAIARDTGLSRSTVQGVLANRRYTGAVIWGQRESHGGARDSRLKKRRTRSDGPLVARQDETQRIISDELFSACNPSRVVAA